MADSILFAGDAPGGNYVSKLMRLAEAHPEFRGRTIPVVIAHDNWCAIYSGAPCNCDPDVEVSDGNDSHA